VSVANAESLRTLSMRRPERRHRIVIQAGERLEIGTDHLQGW
jgi:hypothetical protein